MAAAVDGELDELLGRFINPPGSACRVTGPHRFDEVAEPVTALRRTVYAVAMPHLLLPPVVEAETTLRLDERTDHLCAWAADGALAATLRVSGEPLELPHLSDRCAELAAAHATYGEIGRVITDPGHRRRDHIVRLFAAMVRTMLAGGEAVGVIGVCRRRVVRFYARFGMVAVHDDPLTLAGRPHDDYFVIAGTFERMVEVGMPRLVAAARRASVAGTTQAR